MDQATRRKLIIEIVTSIGSCTYEDLAGEMRVSVMTIRRDIDKLVLKGLLIKVVGGVQSPGAPKEYYESPLVERLQINRLEKLAIAEEALKLIKPPDSIFLDGGTTCLELAKIIASRLSGLTVVTNSGLAYLELAHGPQNTIICIGGQHDPQSCCFIGQMSEEDTRHYFVSQAFFSTKKFIPREGTFESYAPTFRIKQLMAQQCEESILLVDHTKFSQRALCKVFDISQIHTVVTDRGLSEGDVDFLKQKGKKVIISSTKEFGKEHSSAEAVYNVVQGNVR